jgi:hypothetical protein
LASIFPPSPQIGDVFTSNNTTWQWNGEAWTVIPTDGLTFKNITTTPSTQTVVADSGSDTLNLIAGENISITAASASDSITINSTGNYTNVDSISYPDYIVFDTTPENTSASVGTISWDSGESGLSTQLNSNINVTLGQEIYSVVYNGEATQLNKGEVVMISGAQGQKPRVIRAYNTSDAGSARTFGIVAENIESGAEGIVITQGIVKNINTNGFNEGDPLYLSATPGQLTTTKPQAPNHYVWVGVVVKKNSSSGRIYVKPQNGYELDEIHDVRITSVADGDLIVWNSASSLWLNSPKQNIINTASTAAFISASANTLSQINTLTTTDIEEGSNLYFTQQRAIDAIGGTLGTASAAILIEAEDYTDETISNLFIHENHTNLTAEYNGASTQIILRSSGGTPLYGFNAPEIEGIDQQVYYQINSASTAIIDIFQYVNNEWIELNTPVNNWNYTLDENWQWVLNNGDWELLYEGPGLYNASAITFDSEYLPNLVAEIVYLSKSAASATYLPYATASTLYLLKSGGVINGELDVLGNFANAGSVATFDVEHFHLNNNIISLNMGASGAYLDSGIEIYRGASASKVKLAFDETIDKWVFTNDGTNFNELGSGGGTVLYQVDQPDVSELEAGTLWIDSDQDSVSGLRPATFSRWIKTLSGSATTFSGLDDNLNILDYEVDNERVFINGTLLVKDIDYTANSGSAVILTEAALSGDIVEIHSYQQLFLVDTYTKNEVDTLLDNIDALPSQSGNNGKFLTTDGTTADWATIVTGSASFFRWRKTYAASATLISGADDNAINLEYTPGLEQVYINGVMIATNEYTATSGSTIVLNDAVSASDVVDIFGYASINTTSTYSQAQIDAKYNNLTRWKKAYSASATVISGVDDNSNTLSYLSGYEQFYLNGILLTPITDYARTSASVVTLSTALISGDIVEIINTQPFNVADVYNTSQSDSRYEKLIPYSTSTPTSPVTGDMWLDSNSTPPALKVYDGSNWVQLGAAVDDSQAIIASRMFA